MAYSIVVLALGLYLRITIFHRGMHDDWVFIQFNKAIHHFGNSLLGRPRRGHNIVIVEQASIPLRQKPYI